MSMTDPDFGSELRRRLSPELAARQRRSELWALALGVVMGVAVLIDALYARTHGGMVAGGPATHFISLPWWLVAPMALFVLALSLFGLWRMVAKRT